MIDKQFKGVAKLELFAERLPEGWGCLGSGGCMSRANFNESLKRGEAWRNARCGDIESWWRDVTSRKVSFRSLGAINVSRGQGLCSTNHL